MIVRHVATAAVLTLTALFAAPAYASSTSGSGVVAASTSLRQAAYPAPSGGAETPPGAAASQDVPVPVPYDVGLTNLTFHELPDTIQAGQEFTIGADVPAGAACTGTVEYLDGPVQPLDQTPATDGVCWWTLAAPSDLRPGHATVAIDVARNGQARELVGVISVAPPPLKAAPALGLP